MKNIIEKVLKLIDENKSQINIALKEEGREYDFIPPLRKIMDEDFEKGFVACITQQYNYLRESKEEKDIYPLTVECAKYYMENK